MGRPIGSREISAKQIKTIVKLSKKNKTRPQIADEAGVSESTVYRYQKEFDLI